MASRNTYLICVRDLDQNNKFAPEPGETHFLRVPASDKDYDGSHRITKNRWTKAVIAAADGMEDDITGTTGEVLLFVHGYNNDHASILWRTRALQETLSAQGWKGLVIGLDWPSDNSTLNYLEDRSDAAKVAYQLVNEVLEILIDAQFPKDDATPSCTINVHLLGHSTGAYVIMEAFTQAQKRGDMFRKPWRIAQVVFIGADVASDSLTASSEWSDPMYNRIFRLTNYSNRYDKVLGVSNMKRLGTSPRAGRVGLPLNADPKSINVDCSSYFLTKDPRTSLFTGTFNHSWHIGDPNFALDLAMTLEGDIDRYAITTRRMEGGMLYLVAGETRPAYQDQWDETRVPI